MVGGAFDGIRVRADLIGLYETPVLHGHLAEAGALIASLRSAIDARRASTEPGLARSNVGGWHSDTAMLDWGGEGAPTLADTAVKMPNGCPSSTGGARTAIAGTSGCGPTSRHRVRST